MSLAERTTAAATAFLDSLDEPARASARAGFAPGLHHDWHYVPRSRPGVALHTLTPDSYKAALHLLSTGVSGAAHDLACVIMALEDPLDRREGGGRGRHRGDYSILVMGQPGDAAWAWRFEGHHVSVTVTVVDGEARATPAFLGANPASFSGLRVMPREQDLAFSLLEALDGAEAERATLGGPAPDDILTTCLASVAGVLPEGEGLRLGDLAGAAGRAAEALAGCYLGRLPDGHPALAADLARVRFVFAGEATAGEPHYYRLLGPDLLVEYDNTQNDANHIHTVVRHPSGDFGADLLRQHRAELHEPT